MMKTLHIFLLVCSLLFACVWTAGAADIGDVVTLGRYEQDNDPDNGPEPIEWQVIEIDPDNGKMMVISKYALDVKPYHEVSEMQVWETCSLREWLNEDFFPGAFSAEEQKKIIQTTVERIGLGDTIGGPYIVKGGSDTLDNIYILSSYETLERLPGKEARQCEATAYARANGAKANENGYTSWWIRNPGISQLQAGYISASGTVETFGDNVESTSRAVRPVIWVSME